MPAGGSYHVLQKRIAAAAHGFRLRYTQTLSHPAVTSPPTAEGRGLLSSPFQIYSIKSRLASDQTYEMITCAG